MKDFFRTLFACLAALFIAGAMSMFMLFVMIGALASTGDVEPTIEDNSMLVLDLSVNVIDSPVNEDDEVFARIFGSGGPGRVQLRRFVDAIDSAADDDRITGIFMYGNFAPADLGSGYPALMEVREALERFKASGKQVIAYVVGPSMRDYMVASVADRLVMNPMGMIAAPGLSAEVMYLGGTFEKFGIGVQISKAGKYKSAGESYTERHMSEQEREQLTVLLDDLWTDWRATVAASRGIEPDEFQRLVDRHGIFSFEEALEFGLVDEGLSFSDLLGELKEITGKGQNAKTFRQVSLSSYIADRNGSGGSYSSPRVAVVYAEGQIVDGEGGSGYVGGDMLARELRKLRRDKKVRAVVLRVNSPGGSAIASEVIRRELELLHQTKPVVVSMGTVAASGGYWIATESDYVFAQRSTITGSIGVVVMLPNIQGLTEKIDMNIETVRTGEHAGILSLAEPRSEASMAILQALVDDTYTKFIDRVVSGRGLEREAVESVAGGRVWSGGLAVEHSLVDEIGGLRDAVAHAAEVAGLDEFRVVDFPEPQSFMDQLRERLEGAGDPISGEGPTHELRTYVRDGLKSLEVLNDPTHVYTLMPELIRIR